MKKIIVSLLLITLLVPFVSLAQDDLSMGKVLRDVAVDSGYSSVDENTLFFTVAKFLKFFFAVLGIIFMIIVVYAGFRWMTAGGNEEQVTEAKKLLINAVIGVIIVILALSITYFVGGAVSYSTVSSHPY